MQGWRLPGATRLLDSFCDGEDEFVFKRPADDLHADGESLARNSDRYGTTGKAGQVQPLRELHGVAVSRAGEIVSLAVKKRGTCGNRGEQNGRVLHLAQNLGAEEIAVGAGLRELIERNWISKGCKRKILAQHRA